MAYVRFDTSPAEYLIGASHEKILRVFWDRHNAPLEFSALRIALEAHGVEAKDPSHWGILAAALKESGVLETVGRETAVAVSRNQARNSTYRLTDALWAYTANLLAPHRDWPQPAAPTEDPQSEQVPLVGNEA